MADDFSKMAFEADLTEVLATEEAKKWVLERSGDLELLATSAPTSAPSERFQARFVWISYPADPPSYKFRDPATGRLDVVAAWPVVQGYRPTSFDACVNWTAEGFSVHPEWKNDANLRWNPHGNAVLRVLRLMQRDLDDRYQGRAHV
jgi:hypothetical protein